MRETREITRRDFLAATAATAAGSAFAATAPTAATAAGSAFAAEVKKRAIPIGGFTKKLQGLNYEETADAAAEIGWDGIECAVRPDGYVLPERVEEDLPKLADALKKRGLEILIIATRIYNPKDQDAEKVLRTAAKLGIKHYRHGGWKYDLEKPIPPQLENFKAQLRDLQALNKELGLCALYQNHSGFDMAGAPLWDLYEMLKDLDKRYVAAHYDIGHATVEGGLDWRINFRLIWPYVGAIVVKDFVWEYEPLKGGKVKWCSLGEGMVNKEFFDTVLKLGYKGPVTLHFEQKVAGEDAKAVLKKDIEIMKADTRKLKELLRLESA